MQRYGIFHQDGRPRAFYSEDVHDKQGERPSRVPAEAVPIAEEDWQAYVAGPRAWRRDPATGQRLAYTPSAGELAAAERLQARAELATTDAEMARGVEDLAAALTAKGLLRDSDLPVAFLARIADRQALRAKLGQ
jgi:hypothetical protein